MHLRNRLKAPRRFDEEEFDDPARIPHNSSPPSPPSPRPPPAKTRIHPSLQPEIIQFNPNLPPAAFPTLDSWLPRAPENNETKSPLNSPSSSSSSSSSSRSSPCLGPNTSPIDNQNETSPIDNQRENLHEPMLPASPLFASPAMDGSNRSTEQEHIPFTHPHNPIMTSEEAFMLEMQTSDEEDSSESMPRRRKRKMVQFTSLGIGANFGNNRTTSDSISPEWEELSPAHQIDLVLVLSDLHGTIEHAMEKLRLNHEQTKNILDLVEQRKEHESTENERVEALQHRLHQVLLDDNARTVRRMPQETFRKLATDYLYKDLKGEEFYFSTTAEFAKAARYLESCGHQPSSVLDHWHDELGGRVVSRFPAAARSSKSKPSHSEKVGRSEQEVVYPDTPSSLHSPQPATSRDSVYNPSLASASEKSAPNNSGKPAVHRVPRKRSQRNNGTRKKDKKTDRP